MITYRLSFLCKDREEKMKQLHYNDKDKFMSTEHNVCGKEVSHGMGLQIKPKYEVYRGTFDRRN